MKKIRLIISLVLLSPLFSPAQLRVAITGGGHQSTVIESNDLPNWNEIKNNYSARTGAHFGFVADIPFGLTSKFLFQPGVLFFNKGRKYAETFDTTTSSVFTIDAEQYINYIDLPLHIVYKLNLGKKTKFIIGGGPYVSFFYTGKEKAETVFSDLSVSVQENDDLAVGKKPGQYTVLNYGVSGIAGFEFGRVFLNGFYNRGLNDFYRAPSYEGSFKHQVFGVRLGIYLGKPVKIEQKVKDRDFDGIPDAADSCMTEEGPAITNGCPDEDGDGIADKDDKCPTVAGVAANNGCPPKKDSDNDGVPDERDKCPAVPGSPKYDGCEVPDTDKDGLNDEADKCPNVAGLARYDGCPIPDKDGDGVNDEEDKCPDQPGVKEKNGCPAEIKKDVIEKVDYAAKRILFEHAKANLLPESFPVLDEVVKVLTENPNLQLSIEGHTSNDGIFDVNMRLSVRRADNVKAYLISKGIEAARLSTKGFGPTQPLNKSRNEAEKALNRRVELKLSN
jgi:outer membrane protein OmpA-like peptidoglycan-associated protein